MPGGLGYDESGTLAAYFGITFLSFILLPTTYYTLRKAVVGERVQGKECGCSECQEKVKRMRKSEAKGSVIGIRTLAVLVGWALFGFLAYVIYTSPIAKVTVYNPFEILGISSSSDEKAIKRHYKKISLLYHPDKVKLGPNETKEDADARFVEFTKAYKSLTDEAIRENLQKYGNPDGQQPREEKIAIPRWVVEGNNGMWILGGYAFVLGVGLPWMVGRWWFSQRALTKDGALSSTAELFFRELKEQMTFPQLLGLISCAFEFRPLVSPPKGITKKDKRAKANQTEELEKKVTSKAEEVGMGDVLRQQGVAGSGAAKRALALLWSHVLRIDDLSSDLLEERRQLLLLLPKVLPSLLNIALGYRWLSTTSQIMNVSSRLIQACPDQYKPLAQLPGIDLTLANKISGADYELQVNGWQGLLNEKREEDEGGKEVEEVDRLLADLPKEAKNLAKEMPSLKVLDATFQVEGEDVVSPGSFVQFTYTVYLAEEKDSAEEDNEPIEKSNVAQVTTLGKKPSNATADGGLKSKDIFAHSPRWPTHRKPHWWVMIGDPTVNRIIVPPQRIADIPVQSTSSLRSGRKPQAKTYKIQFQAPPEPSVHHLEAYWISDTYLGCNVTKAVVLTVEQPPAEDMYGDDNDEDISDPEEDTIAGQLAALRGDKYKRIDREDDEEEEGDDDESGTDDGEVSRGADDSSSDSDSD